MHCNRHGRFDCTDSVCETWYGNHGYTVPQSSVGVDVTTGDLVINVGGFGVDVTTGQAELNLGGGIDVPL